MIVATNGFAGKTTPWLQRRIIPIGNYIIATEEIPADLVARLLPSNRIISDTRKVLYCYRASPDRRRICDDYLAACNALGVPIVDDINGTEAECAGLYHDTERPA